MTPKIPVHNPGAMPMYVAGLMIPPGETRHFDADLVPLHLRPAAPAPVADEPQYDPLAELLEGNVKAVVTALPDLDDEDLARLGELEQARGDAARKGVLSAIAEETLTRADVKTGEAGAAAGNTTEAAAAEAGNADGAGAA